MKIIIKLLLVFIGLLSIVHAEESRDIPILAATMEKFASPQKHEIWPRFDLRVTPTVVHYKNGNVYAFQHRNLSPLWTKKNIEGYPVLFSHQQPQLNQIPLHPSFVVEGIPSFVFSMEHGGGDEFSLLTLVHERFHLHQFRYFGNLSEIGEYVDHHQVTNLALMELENRLLIDFLKSPSKKIKGKLLRDFLAVAATRHATLNPSSLIWESHLQRMEGMADYVSLRTYQVFDLLADFIPEKKLLEMRSKKISPSLYQDIVKGRNYFVGATLGFALDFCEVDGWKFDVTKGDKSLHELLAIAIPLSSAEQINRLSQAKKEYDYTAIEELFTEKLAKEKEQLSSLQATFEEQKGISISIGLPDQHSSSGGTHKESFHFDQMKVSVEETSVSVSQDEQWKLDFTAIPIVFEDKGGVRLFKVEEPTIEIDNKEIAVAEITEMQFKAITLKSTSCGLKATLPGTLRKQGDSLHIHFQAAK